MSDDRAVFFFDIDNCLYPRSKKVHDLMSELIDKYFMTHLNLTQQDAYKLHQEYYRSYGLAIEGLVRYHKIDPMEYNRQVDDALPLQDVITSDPELRKLLESIDTSKVKPWLLTNAYRTHGERVVRLLGVDDLFEGITFCDYASEKFVCKPHEEMYRKAMADAGVKTITDCLFVDDSYANCKKAHELGWKTAHLVEEGVAPPTNPASDFQIKNLQELRSIFPEAFK